MVVVLAIVVLLILGGASPLGDRLWQWVHRLWQQEPKNLAVLPFTNISELPESQAFCDGLTETLTTKLTELEQSYGALSIVPAIEVRGIRGVSEAERRLGVNLVITGSVQRTAGSIRLTLNLVDTKTRRQLRSEIIDKSMADLLDLQDGVVLEVVKLLQLERKPAALGLVAAGGTAVPGAYDFYLKGTGYLQQYYRVHYSPEPLAKAIEFFQSALKADPNFAMAYSALGDALWRSYLDPKRRDPALVEEARRKCRRAIELNEGLVPAHVGLGRILNGTGQREQAIEEFKKALQLDPMNSDTYRELANVYSAMGRTHQAESTYQKAIELRPDSWPAYSYLGYFYFLQGRYLEAESQFKRVLALAPDNLTAQENLGAMYFSMGRYEEAAGVFEYLLTIEPTPSLFSNAGTVCFYQGQYAKAVEMYEKAIEGGVNDHVIWGNLADGYHMLPGSSAKAQQAYRRAIEQVEKSLQVNPRDAAAHCDLAFYLVKFGDKGRALKEVETALELDRSNVNIGVRSAVVYELAGHRDQALQSLSEAIHRGYAIKEIESEPEFKDLRKDTRYPQIVK
jgi:tetratricopeptide (TPR) repeat protein